MTHGIDPHDAAAWETDLPAQTATHSTGLVVQLSPDALFDGKWAGRCMNARAWAEEDFEARAPLIPLMVRAAIDVFTQACDARCKNKK